ncbi:MAG: hypothetical protein BWY47_00026 [Bacteroidetes bacterium ADurb.Bin302]|nr:MAG: hypothetical protein BWY47_00026 [Bacteroidetes bacterium ADurb.Bin302]
MALQNSTTSEYVIVKGFSQNFDIIFIERYKDVTTYNNLTEWDTVKYDGIYVENYLTTNLALACNNAQYGDGTQTVMAALIDASELALLELPQFDGFVQA